MRLEPAKPSPECCVKVFPMGEWTCVDRKWLISNHYRQHLSNTPFTTSPLGRRYLDHLSPDQVIRNPACDLVDDAIRGKTRKGLIWGRRTSTSSGKIRGKERVHFLIQGNREATMEPEHTSRLFGFDGMMMISMNNSNSQKGGKKQGCVCVRVCVCV